MKSCYSCKYYIYDYSTGTSECKKYFDMTEDETEKYYTNGENNCSYYESECIE